MVEGVVASKGDGENTSAWRTSWQRHGGTSNGDNDEEAKVLDEADWKYFLFLLGIRVWCQGLMKL